jgi:hypothetical protein
MISILIILCDYLYYNNIKKTKKINKVIDTINI